MRRCTWVGCDKDARHEQISKDQADVWADLCDDHVEKLYDVIQAKSSDEEIKRAWIDAQGGREKAAQRINLRRLRAAGFKG